MRLLTYAEYHKLMGEWFATGRILGRPARQVAHELLPQEKCATVRVYWRDKGNTEYLVPMTTQEGAQWTTTTR